MQRIDGRCRQIRPQLGSVKSLSEGAGPGTDHHRAVPCAGKRCVILGINLDDSGQRVCGGCEQLRKKAAAPCVRGGDDMSAGSPMRRGMRRRRKTGDACSGSARREGEPFCRGQCDPETRE